MKNNLNFVPTQKTINKDTIKKQFEDFFRQTKLRAYFKTKKNKNISSEEDRFKKPTNKNGIPTNNHHSIETFIEATYNETKAKVEETLPSKYSNLTIKEWKAMQELQSRKDTVIADTGKCGAIVILMWKIMLKKQKDSLTTKKTTEK